MRIIICGLNGAGKSTLGRALAGQLHYEFRDIEDYYDVSARKLLPT